LRVFMFYLAEFSFIGQTGQTQSGRSFSPAASEIERPGQV